jgi:uncharacterized protein
MKLAGYFVAAALALAAQPVLAQEPAGEWHANLRPPGSAAELRLGLNIEVGADGKLTGRIVSVDQGNAIVTLENVGVSDGTLRFEMPAQRAKFEGRWDPAQEGWVGTFTQGAPIAMTFLKGAVPSRNRPQTPTAPYPYRTEDVVIESAPGVKLSGTLTMPQGPGPFPAAVLISGSGAQTRDSEVMSHKLFLVLADHLTRKGIAVLRYDDRGVGKSTGDHITATSEDFAVDAAAAVSALRRHSGIDAKRTGYIGLSEGGLVGPMAAAKDPGAAFVVMLAGPGAPSKELMAAQRAAVLRGNGATEDRVARNQAAMDKIDRAVIAARSVQEAKSETTRLLYANAADLGITTDTVPVYAQAFGTAWYKSFIAADPRSTLSRLTIPVLALNGSKDVQVVANQNLPAIREAVKANPKAVVRELPGLNHLFQTAPTGNPAEYGQIEETMAPVALNTVSEWILALDR